MENFNFYSPTEFVFGKGCAVEAGRLVKKYGGTKVLIHYGGGSAVKSGLIDKVKKSLEDAGVPYCELGGVQPNPRDTLIYKGIELGRSEGVDIVLAVGGGSVIDSAKGIALGIPYDGDFWDFYSGKGARNDILRPKFSIMDPALTQTLPAYQTAAGCTDIMAHIFERYFTNTPEVEITDRLCEAVLLTMIKEAPRVIADPDNYEARANIMWAGMIAHNNICGVGRQQDWNSHNLEHELSALYDVTHGAGLAVMMPAWMEYVYKHNVLRFCQMATRVFGCQMDYENPEATAVEGIRRFRSFLHSIGMPINFAELGAKEEDIPVLVEKLGIGSGKRAGFMELDRNDVTEIYRIAAHASL